MLSICIQAENRKLRHSVIWLAVFLLPVIPAFMGAGNYWMNREILSHDWYSLWTQFTLFYAIFFYGPLTALYASYLWRLEHFQNNCTTLFSLPVSARCICLGKLSVICRCSLLTQLVLLFLFFVSGKLFGFAGFIPAQILLWSIRGLFASFAVGSLQLLLSYVIKSFAVPIALSLLGGVAGLLVTAYSDRLGFFWPYALVLLGMNSNKTEELLSGMGLPFFVSTFLFSLLFLEISRLLIERRKL